MEYESNRPASVPEQQWVEPARRFVRRAPRSAWEGFSAIIVALLASVIVVAVSVGGIFAYALFAADTVLPGVRALDIPLGGLTAAEAETRLQAEWSKQTIVLRSAGSETEVAPATLGYTFDAKATALAAQRYGRDRLSLQRLNDALQGADVQPVIRFDATVAEKGLHTLAPQYAKAAGSAGIRLVNGALQVQPAVAGQSLDVPATLADLRADPLAALAEGEVTLSFKAVPPPANADTAALQALAAQLRITPISVRAYDPIANKTTTWNVAPDVWFTWLSVDPAKPAWLFDGAKAQAWLTSQSTALGAVPYVDAKAGAASLESTIRQKGADLSLRVYHRQQTHIVRSGESIAGIAQQVGMPYLYILQANPNVGDFVRPGDVLVIPSADAFVPLPVVENKRIVVSISKQKLWAYENGAVKWEWADSTGIASSPTSPGVYQVQSHQLSAYAGIWNLDMPYFLGIYKPVPGSDFMNGIHGFPKRNGSQILWTGNLGAPITFGCVLVSTTNAKLLYDWAQDGVVVEIQA